VSNNWSSKKDPRKAFREGMLAQQGRILNWGCSSSEKGKRGQDIDRYHAQLENWKCLIRHQFKNHILLSTMRFDKASFLLVFKTYLGEDEDLRPPVLCVWGSIFQSVCQM